MNPAEPSYVDIQGLISIKVKTTPATTAQDPPLIEHLSAGNLGLFAIITEKRKLRIYWPRPELLQIHWADADDEEPFAQA